MNQSKAYMKSLSIIVLLLFFVLLPNLSFANPYKFITYYYLNPQPQEVAKIFALIDSVEKPMVDKDDWTIAVFLSEVIKKDPALAGTLTNQRANHSRRGRYTIALAICQSGFSLRDTYVDALLPEKELADIRDEMKNSNFRPVLELPVDSALVLDMLWIGFFATGDSRFIERIITPLNVKDENDGNQILLQAAARWSLGSNARQHPRVLAICKDIARLRKNSSQVTAELKQIVSKAEQKKK